MVPDAELELVLALREGVKRLNHILGMGDASARRVAWSQDSVRGGPRMCGWRKVNVSITAWVCGGAQAGRWESGHCLVLSE